MSINEFKEKVKSFLNRFYWPIFGFLLVSILLAFWQISILDIKKGSIKIYSISGQELIFANNDENTAFGEKTIGQSQLGEVIGSKNSKKYYFPWCGTVKMIKPQNQIKFVSIVEA